MVIQKKAGAITGVATDGKNKEKHTLCGLKGQHQEETSLEQGDPQEIPRSLEGTKTRVSDCH